jgi:hypothetical protein
MTNDLSACFILSGFRMMGVRSRLDEIQISGARHAPLQVTAAIITQASANRPYKIGVPYQIRVLSREKQNG